MTVEEAIEQLKTMISVYHEGNCTAAMRTAIKALETIEQVKHEIKESKKILSNPTTVVNQDYRTGYLCGLAFVEGVIA